MRITLITKSGAAAVIKPIKNTTGLGRDEIVRLEIEGGGQALNQREEQIVGELFSGHAVIYLVLLNYPSNVVSQAMPPIAERKRVSVHQLRGETAEAVRVFGRCREYKYGEFFIFATRSSTEQVEAIISGMRTIDTLTVLANRDLALTALIGVDAESDTYTIASVDSALVSRAIDEALNAGI